MKTGVFRVWLLRILFALTLAALALLGYSWQHMHEKPPLALYPMPDSLTALDSLAGQKLLAQSQYKSDYDSLSAHLETQQRRAFFGIASAVTAINALLESGHEVTQQTFFTPSVSEQHPEWRATFGGTTLSRLSLMIGAFEYQAESGDLLAQFDSQHYPAENFSEELFRKMLKANLLQADNIMLVNYQRSELGQANMEHISPVAAYHTQSDQVLILDTASYHYPSAWVPVSLLWKAMNRPNIWTRSGRGFIELRIKQ
jgi:hypothetical protein